MYTYNIVYIHHHCHYTTPYLATSASAQSHHRHQPVIQKHDIRIGPQILHAAIRVIMVLSFIFLVKRSKRQRRDPMISDVVSFEGPHRLYSYDDLKSATNNFSNESLIEEGSFGCVYKGVLRDGTLAAVKVFNMDQRGATKSFLAQCEALRNIHLRNLVKILNACSNSTFKALVLQFMPNGRLERWLYHKNGDQKQGLTLKQRLEIVIDVALAMEYLHHDCENAVVHCDLKPSNVLLDQDMTAHVGDFGLARMLYLSFSNTHMSSTIGLEGSIGYIAPVTLVPIAFYFS